MSFSEELFQERINELSLKLKTYNCLTSYSNNPKDGYKIIRIQHGNVCCFNFFIDNSETPKALDSLMCHILSKLEHAGIIPANEV